MRRALQNEASFKIFSGDGFCIMKMAVIIENCTG